MSELDPKAIVAKLDAISRERALTRAESLLLEKAMRSADGGRPLPSREVIRLGFKRHGAELPAHQGDPRARRVIDCQQLSGRRYQLKLECGHVQRRQMMCVPDEVICSECPVPTEWTARNLNRSIPVPKDPRPLTERMTAARDWMTARNRTPRVFFLESEHYAEFEATSPPRMTAVFSRHGVPKSIECLSFEGLPVRLSESKLKGNSKLYCCVGTSVLVPIR